MGAWRNEASIKSIVRMGRRSGTPAAKPIFSWDFPAHILRFAVLLFEELDRSLAAAHRYEQLRITHDTAVPRRDRASKARQVFAELYSGRQHGRAASASTE